MRILFALLLIIGRVLGADIASTLPQRGSFRATLTRDVGYDYLLSLPSAYGKHTARRWPTILFLHGAGEAGADLNRLLQNGQPKIIAIAQGENSTSATPSEAADLLTTQFIVISPQCPFGRGWDADALIAFLDDIAAKYRVDPARVYVTGFSMGGFGTWSLGMKYPDRFAAIAPICGGGDLVQIGEGLPAKRAALQSLPIWVFHGANDTAVPVAESERMIDAVKRVGGNSAVRLTVYPDTGHDSWTETYRDAELYRWFLQQKR